MVVGVFAGVILLIFASLRCQRVMFLCMAACTSVILGTVVVESFCNRLKDLLHTQKDTPATLGTVTLLIIIVILSYVMSKYNRL